MADDRFSDIGFEDFRRMAQDGFLSRYERIGFPDSYREGFGRAIFDDIRAKLTLLEKPGGAVLDIGPGCSELPEMLIQLCRDKEHELWLVDSEEMLGQLPDGPAITKIPAMYPDCSEFLQDHQGSIDVILCYSVMHYIFVEAGFFRFIDESLALLSPGGQFLIGDIPNVSKRKRFFAGEAGREFHRKFMGTDEDPVVEFNTIERGELDDAVMMAILQRARQAGFDAYLLPQRAGLPMANRREDILITRP